MNLSNIKKISLKDCSDHPQSLQFIESVRKEAVENINKQDWTREQRHINYIKIAVASRQINKNL